MALSALAPSTDDVALKIDSVQIYIDTNLLGNASLHVTQSRLSWIMETGQSFSLEYLSINMHSISRDTKNFPHECLLMMVEGDLASKADAIMKGETPVTKKDDQDAISEIRIVLPDSTLLQSLFDHMSDCQALHEEQQQIAMEDEGEFEEEYGEDEDAEEEEDTGDDVAVLDAETAVDFSSCCPGEEDMTPQGLATLKRLEACLTNGVTHSENGTNQFEDAEAEPMATT